MRVLICDDDADMRTLYRIAFEKQGVEVDEAEDGDACLLAVVERTPDLVVLDLHMPKRDGLSTLPLLRRSWPDCPVVIVSAHAAVDVFETSRARGASACFDKLGFLPRIPWVVQRFVPPAA